MKRMLFVLASTVMFGVSVGFVLPQSAAAAVPVFQSCSANPGSAICAGTSDRLFGPNSIWNKIINTIIFAGGAIAILMIVIGGIRYTLSGGDQGGINSAKNTILYAVVGLVVSVSAYAIVNFVL